MSNLANDLESTYNPSKLSPKIVWLEPETLDEAKFMNSQTITETNQWLIYLNTLALHGFEKWLRERRPGTIINKDIRDSTFENICFLCIGEYRLCLIVLDNLVENFVSIPAQLITSNNTAAHFYILVEVLEEEEQLNIHGFLRYDLLSKYSQMGYITLQTDGSYQLNLSLFDAELNNLLQYISFLEPSAIKLPVVAENKNSLIEKVSGNINKTKTQLGRVLVNLDKWCDGVIEEGWKSTKSVWDTIPNNLAWGCVRSRKELKDFPFSQTKLFDFGILLQNKCLALTVNLKDKENQERVVLVQVLPCEDKILPPDLKLKVTLNPNTSESISREVRTRETDNAIQLEFSEKIGREFQVEISYEGAVLLEEFTI